MRSRRSETANRARALRMEGLSVRQIADRLGVSKSAAWRVLEGTCIEESRSQLPISSGHHVRRPVAPGVFVGRDREMDLLEECLKQTKEGVSQIILLGGEAGIGKTRLALELANIAREQRTTVLWGRSYEAVTTPPYWPWIQAIRTYVRQRDPRRLTRELGEGAADIATLCPDVMQGVPSIEPQTPSDDPHAARMRLFDSITGFFARASRWRPVLLILENLHWADASSLLLLEFLVQEISHARLMVVGLYRDTDVESGSRLYTMLGALVRHPFFRHLALGPLAEHEVGALLEGDTRVKPDPAFIRVLHQRTGGNPLYLVELLRMFGELGVRAEGELPEISMWDTLIPDTVHMTLNRRLDRLPSSFRRTLEVASIIGREFDRTVLEQVVPDAQGSVNACLEEAMRTRVIEEAPSSIGRYRFTHALVQEATASQISTIERAHIHAEIGRVLEGLHRGEIEPHAAELAHHFRAAVPVAGSEKAVRYSAMAGRHATSVLAFEDALIHLDWAMEAVSSRVMDHEKAEVLSDMGLALSATAQERKAWKVLNQAFEYYVDTGNQGGVADIVDRIPKGIYPDALVRMVYRAVAITRRGSHARGRLLSHLGLILGEFLGDYHSARASFDESLEIARRHHDPVLEMRTLVSSARIAGHFFRQDEALERGLAAIDVAARTGQTAIAAAAYSGVASARFRAGRTDEARVLAARGVALAEARRLRVPIVYCLSILWWIDMFKGDWPRARESSNRMLTLFPGYHPYLSLRAWLEAQIGAEEEADRTLTHAVELMLSEGLAPFPPWRSYSPALIAAIAYIRGADRYLELAEEWSDAILAAESSCPFESTTARTALGLIAVCRQDGEAAQEQYVALRHSGLNPWVLTYDRLMGLLAHTMGDVDAAKEHFDKALEFCRDAQWWPEFAWTCYEYASLLLESIAPDDRNEARRLLREAAKLGESLQMRPLADRVSALMDKTDISSRRDVHVVEPLTPRELEVLRLIALGNSNQQISERLAISPNTVAFHVRNILTKTGAANRAEAAVKASHRGLV